MAKTLYVTAENNRSVHKDVTKKSEVKSYSIDFSAWAEDNSAISTAAWTVEYGQASVSNESLSSNVASATISFSEVGTSLIKVVATGSGGEAYVFHLDIQTRDPRNYYSNHDYGMCN